MRCCLYLILLNSQDLQANHRLDIKINMVMYLPGMPILKRHFPLVKAHLLPKRVYIHGEVGFSLFRGHISSTSVKKVEMGTHTKLWWNAALVEM